MVRVCLFQVRFLGRDQMKSVRLLVSVSVCMISLSTAAVYVQAQRRDQNQPGPGGAGGGQGTSVQDPGVRASSSTTGQPLATLSSEQLQFFQDGMARFFMPNFVSG